MVITKNNELQQFLFASFLALVLILTQSCYASYDTVTYESDYVGGNGLGIWIGAAALGVGAAAVIALMLNSKSSSSGPSASTTTSTTQLPVINSSSNYNLLSVNGSVAIGKISVTNKNDQAVNKFDITQSGAVSVVVDPESSCLQPVPVGGKCTFDISYTGTLGSSSSVPVLFTIGNNANSDVVTVNVINIPANTFFDPTVVGTNASSIYTKKNTGQTSFVTVSKNNSSFLYAGHSTNGVFKTNDGGATWMVVNNGLTNKNVNNLCLYDSSLYAATTGGVFKTSNGGASWTAVNDGLTGNALKVQNLYSYGGSLYIGTGDGVFKISDGGNGWQTVSNELKNLVVKSLCSDGVSLYAGTNDSGVYKLDVNGESWTAVNDGLTGDALKLKVQNLYLYNNLLYVGTGNGVFKRSDGGDSWQAVGNELGGLTVTSLCSDGISLYAGTGDGVYKLSVDGTSWKNLVRDNVMSLGLDSGFLYIGIYGDGVYKISNDGSTWMSTSNRFNTGFTALCQVGNYLFARSFTSPIIYVSSDYGDTWSVFGRSIGNITSLYFDGLSLYVGTDKGVEKINLINNTQSSAGLTDKVVNILYPHNNSLYVGTNDGSYKTADGGISWSLVSGVSGVNVSALYSSGSSLYAGTNSGAFTLNSSGVWEAIGDSTPNVSSLCMYNNSLYAGTNSGVSKLSNGLTWTVVDNANLFSKIATLYSYGNSLYAGGSGGVYKLVSDTWSNLFSDAGVASLHFQAGYLYAGTVEDGIRKMLLQ